MWKCLVCVFAIVSLSRGAKGTLAEQMAEMTQLCCNKGTSYARNHTSEECSSSIPPDVPSQFGSLCIFAMDQCCREYFQKKKDCDRGIDIAITLRRCDTTSDSTKNCCDECERGMTTGTSRGAEVCSVGSRGNSAEELLASDAYTRCCKKAAIGTEKHAGNRLTRHTARPITLYKRPASSDIASVCEEYAPNELCAHHCIPVPGSYKCECNPGYMLMPDGRNCKEVEKNRCKPRNPCQHKCNDNGVQVKCSCKRGYQLMSDGRSCEDIDECLLDPPVCMVGNQCQNTRGSYKCIPSKRNSNSVEKGQCPPGFARNIQNNACDDINECELPHPPCPVYSCENTIGAYKCDGVSGDPANLNNLPRPSTEERCPPGFKTGLNEECEDIDECAIRKDDCNQLSQYCINKRGSFHCQDKVSKHCPPGFKINPINNKCEDINECEDGEDICRPDQICVNVPGEYDCKLKVDESRRSKHCPEGMRIKPGNAACEDIDECVEGTHLCDQYQTCLNTNGSHECHCKLGFELDSKTGACVDINECATDQHNCISESQRCDNTVGSYLCIRFTSCGTGYILHHSTSKCEDIDECALGIHNCARAGPEYQCVNTPGSFRCIRHRPSTTSTTPEPEYEYEYYDVEEDIGEGNQSNSQDPGTPKENRPEEPPTTTTKPEISSTTPSTTPTTHPTELPPPPEVTPQGPEERTSRPEERPSRPEERPSEPEGIPSGSEETLSRPEERPIRPEEKPSRPEEKPSKPEEIPSKPEESPIRPEEIPRRPEKRPSRPEERSSRPEERPDRPEERPSRPEERPNRPEERPSAPEKSSSESKETFSRPEVKPSRSEESFPRPEGRPSRPEERPNRPEERPNRPKESSSIPEERPSEPKDKFSRPEEGFSKAEERPSRPEERSSWPEQSPRSTDENVRNSERPNISVVDDRLNSILPFDPTDNEIKPGPSYNEPIQPESPKPTEPPRQPEINYSEPQETKPQQPYSPTYYKPKPPEQSTYYQPIEPKSSERPEPNEPDPNGIDFEPYEPRYPETTHISIPDQQPERPSSPEVVYVNVGKETATVEGKKTKDGAVIVDTKNIPKNEWTKINAKPSNCQFGFEMDEYGACFDIDECATNRHSCSGLTEVCRNTMGGYLCDCAPGFRRVLATGVCDLMTTSTSTTTSTTTPTPTASTTKNKDFFWGYDYRPNTNKPFRPRLLCDVGYQLNSTTGKCEDLNECTNGQANCAAVEVCVNTQGGYRCECPPNWKLDEVRHRCVPVRKNGQFPPGYENEPVYPSPDSESTINHGPSGNKYVEPEYTQIGDRGSVFKCPWGYRLGDDNTCEDINECLTGDAKCGPLQLCTNSPGGYTCSCPRGHRLVADHECEDVDECKLAGSMPICSHHADCINTVGSYQCHCHNGFRSAPANDKVCVDVDECTESRPKSLCQQRCNNVWGGYRCSCHRGYRLNPDNSTCSDVDECTEFKSKILCVGRCVNEPGSYRCTCPAGYRLSEDKRSCIDVDECETGEAPCANSSTYGGTSDVCQNTRGGFRCHRIVCPPGYKLENKHRCTKVDRVCPAGDWNCAHQPTTYSYNFITFVSKLYIPASKVDLFTMRGPSWPYAKMRFQLRLVDVNAPPTIEKCDIHAFLLSQTGNQAVVSLIKSLEGPQSIELELSMELYNKDQFGGTAVARLYIHVSEYEF